MGYGFLIISSSSTLIFLPILIIICPLLIQTQTAADNKIPQYNCSSTSGQYIQSSTYESNLMNLMAGLKNNTSPNHGFWNTSHGGDPDRVYGLALCRGDVSSFDCQTCVDSVTTLITFHCQYSRAAIYWSDYCNVKYSNVDFFGEIDTDNKFIMVNPDNVSYYVTTNLTAVALGLLSNLSKNATADNHMFATGNSSETQAGGFLRGMVQCSGDLSKHNCSKCLDYAMKQLPTYITEDGHAELFSPGARTVTGSCNVRYESYDFKQ